MPLRVRCRCGQELILRYGEWVYVFIGLALLAVLVNMLGLLLLYFRVEERMRTPAASLGAEQPVLNQAPLLKVEHPSPRERPVLPEGNEPTPDTAPRSMETPGDFPPRVPFDREGPPRKMEEPRPAPPASESSSAHSTPPPSGEPKGGTKAEGPRGPRIDPPWNQELALLRILLLERGGDEVLPPAAFLKDPDECLRHLAIERSLSRLGFQTKAEGRRACLLIQDARWAIRGDPRGLDLLRKAGLESGDILVSPEADTERDLLLESLRAAAARFLSDRSTQALREYAARIVARGADIVLAVDSSRSMRSALEGLRSEAKWLLPAISWALPGARVGLVFYRDDVESCVPLRARPDEALKALEEVRAEGGADVPEGVHHALRAALSLGWFDWRDGASRDVIFLGDAPPPFPERGGALLLAAQASRQGNYRTHALSFEPGGDSLAGESFFFALAASGGGRSKTIRDTKRIGPEFLLCLFPDEASSALEASIEPLKLIRESAAGFRTQS